MRGERHNSPTCLTQIKASLRCSYSFAGLCTGSWADAVISKALGSSMRGCYMLDMAPTWRTAGCNSCKIIACAANTFDEGFHLHVFAASDRDLCTSIQSTCSCVCLLSDKFRAKIAHTLRFQFSPHCPPPTLHTHHSVRPCAFLVTRPSHPTDDSQTTHLSR